MTGIAERIEMNRYCGKELDLGSEWAPYRGAAPEDRRRVQIPFSGFCALAVCLLFSGFTVAVGSGHAGLAESYGISPESILVTAWLIQGATALFGFVLAVRWLRS